MKAEFCYFFVDQLQGPGLGPAYMKTPKCPTNPTDVMCPICERIMSKFNLNQHWNKKSGQCSKNSHNYRCPKCAVQFNGADDFIAHLPCKICSAQPTAAGSETPDSDSKVKVKAKEKRDTSDQDGSGTDGDPDTGFTGESEASGEESPLDDAAQLITNVGVDVDSAEVLLGYDSDVAGAFSSDDAAREESPRDDSDTDSTSGDSKVKAQKRRDTSHQDHDLNPSKRARCVAHSGSSQKLLQSQKITSTK